MILRRTVLAAAISLIAADAWAANPRTPIEHLIVIVGENRTFDNLFATYQPKAGETIANLLSRGIVRADGSPGPNFKLAEQHTAEVTGAFAPTPKLTGSYARLPQPYAADAFGQRQDIPDRRFTDPMPNGPFQITQHVSYGAHTGNPVHRFFQMWQQIDGGKMDLFVWTAESVGLGPSNTDAFFAQNHTLQGGVAMGFFNMASGDGAYFRSLADRYAIADNYHQSILGGTTVNYFALATRDVGFHTAGGQPAVPPSSVIENPDPQPGTNNWYKEDGFRGGTYVARRGRGGGGVGPNPPPPRGPPIPVFKGRNLGAGPLLHGQQSQPALPPRRPAAGVPPRQSAAAAPDD